MSKKIRNVKASEAQKHKLREQNRFAEIGLSLESDIFSFGIVLDNMGLSQLNYFCFDNINRICKTYCGIDIHVFCHEMGQQLGVPLFPVFNVSDLSSYEYPLIATSASTLKTAISSKSKNVYYYMFDAENNIEWINENNIKTILRHKNFQSMMKNKLGEVEGFDLNEIIKIIIGDIKNG